ncbi:MAG: hypothetical protein A2521_13645 [Deltaproteobacteria bacterium RIFOXYD12_FULL_57_12]|nr:MAG: hypothetical protein A2521_13645 [Deltaproteobacteria bacterium RIFOXYD12_FULL_57_12]
MSSRKIEFQGKDIAEAIKNACTTLNVPQEDLDIEVLNTGSSGIFGLCRQKAKLRVSVKPEVAADSGKDAAPAEPRQAAADRADDQELLTEVKSDFAMLASDMGIDVATTEPDAPPTDTGDEDVEAEAEDMAAVEVSPAVCETVRVELLRLLELMGLPAEVTISQERNTVVAHIGGGHVDKIVGPEGKVLDSLQYLLRKMIAKKIVEKVVISLDAGDFRAGRDKDIEELARKLAAEVKATGKTGSIPSLNPSERRAVHLLLQEDRDIRSRSVGEGLFKKVLIYRPGKGRKGTARRRKGGGGAPGSSSEPAG